MQLWKHCEDSEDRSYFYNTTTEESVWDVPEGEDDWLECEDPKTGKPFYHNSHRDISVWNLPSLNSADKWLECIDSNTGRTFYYDVKTRQSVWQKPDENEDEEVEEQKGERESASSLSDIESLEVNGFHDYVLKEGGGTTMFGRKSWKKRFMVLQHGEIGWFKSYKDFAAGHMPLKGRWTNLQSYRLEEMLSEPLGVRLLPMSIHAGDRLWNLKLEDKQKKIKLIEALTPHVSSQGFVKTLDRELSGRRFLAGFT